MGKKKSTSSDRKASTAKAGKRKRYCQQWPNCIHTSRTRKERVTTDTSPQEE